MSRHVSPSVLAANFNDLQKEVGLINDSHASWLHCDIMDGVFVPNISFGFSILEHLKSISTKPLDVHLMIIEPEKYIDRFCQIGIDILTVHIEVCKHLHRTLQQIREKGVKAGVTLNPHTPINQLSEIIRDVDLVLIMSVNPGFGGQKLIENTYKKIDQLKELILKTGSKALIQVDGGVDETNAGKLYQHGADILVAGTSVFRADNPVDAVNRLLNV